MDQNVQPTADETKPLDVSQFADLVGMMSRFLSRLSEIEEIKAEELGLIEWLSLRQIAQSEAVRSRQLALNLGVTRQRVAQISKALKASGLIETVETEGSKALTLTATEAGKAKSQRMEEVVGAMLAQKFEGKAVAIERMAKRLSTMLRAIKPVKAE